MEQNRGHDITKQKNVPHLREDSVHTFFKRQQHPHPWTLIKRWYSEWDTCSRGAPQQGAAAADVGCGDVILDTSLQDNRAPSCMVSETPLHAS